MNNKKEIEYLNVRQSSKFLGISTQSVYSAIKKKMIDYVIFKKRYCITKKSLMDYKNNKYDRRHTLKLNVYEYTVKEICNILDISKSTAHYLIRKGYIRSYKIGYQHIIKKTDLVEYLKNHSPIS